LVDELLNHIHVGQLVNQEGEWLDVHLKPLYS